MRAVVVGAGLAGCSAARRLADADYDVTVIEKRDHIGGLCETGEYRGTQIHKYGAHIFHTDNEDVFEFLSRFTEWVPYQHQVVADVHDTDTNYRVPLPFSVATYSIIYGTPMTPMTIRQLITADRASIKDPDESMESKAIWLVGRKVYELLVKDYTYKQWGKYPTELPASLITRLPIRNVWDTRYFNDRYQFLPRDGYTKMMHRMIDHPKIEILLNHELNYGDLMQYDLCVWTAPVDELPGTSSQLPWRTIMFDNQVITCDLMQGIPVLNYVNVDPEKPRCTRRIEHWAFRPDLALPEDILLITEEYPQEWSEKCKLQKMYPVNNEENNSKARRLRAQFTDLCYQYCGMNVVFAGRGALYEYLDMDDTVASVLNLDIPEISHNSQY